MIILTMGTEHYLFEGAGDTDAEAQHAMGEALRYHGEACNLPEGWWKGHYDIERREYVAGEAYRDKSLLYRTP